MTRKVMIAFVLIIVYLMAMQAEAFTQHDGRRFSVRIYIPSIDRNTGKSSITEFLVSATEGTGRVTVKSSAKIKPSINVSVWTAIEAAEMAVGLDLSRWNIEITIRTRASAISGMSGEAGLEVAIVAAVLGLPIRGDAAITGSLALDGSITPVAEVEAKASAIAEANLRFFLIPKLNEVVSRINASSGRMEIVNLSRELNNRYNITIIPVGDVWEAFRFLTGFEINKAFANKGEINSNRYNKLLRWEAEEMYRSTARLLEELEAKYDEFKAQIQEVNWIESSIDGLKNNLNEARILLGEEKYYTSMCKSFQMRVKIRNLSNTIRYLSSRDMEMFLEELRKEAKKSVDNAKKFLAGTRNDVVCLNLPYSASGQAAATGYLRVLEAESLLERAEGEVSAGLTKRAIEDLSFTIERAQTAIWWMNFSVKVERLLGASCSPLDEEKVIRRTRLQIEKALSVLDLAEDLLDELQEEGATGNLEEVRAIFRQEKRSITKLLTWNITSAVFLESLEAVSLFELLLFQPPFSPIGVEGSFTNSSLHNLIQQAELWSMLALNNSGEPLLPILYLEFGRYGFAGEQEASIHVILISRRIGKGINDLQMEINPDARTVKIEVKKADLGKFEAKDQIIRNLTFGRQMIAAALVVIGLAIIVFAVFLILRGSRGDIGKQNATLGEGNGS